VIDILFAIMMIVAIFKGYRKGLIIAAFSIIAFIIGLAAALKLSAVVAAYLQQNISVSTKWLPFLSFALVFFAVVLLVNWGGKLIEKTVEMALLGWANKIGGILLFAALYTIIYSIFLFYAIKINLFDKETIVQSVAYPFVKPWGPVVIDSFGSIIPIFKNTFAQLEQFFQGISDKVK
jgi:membrane protein required for colicin V production